MFARCFIGALAVFTMAPLSGCYSSAFYRGDGRIESYSGHVARYRVILPEIDIDQPGTHAFTMAGLPRQCFMPVLQVAPDQADSVIDRKTRITATLQESGRLIDQRAGALGIAWRIAADDPTSPPGVELITDRSERAPDRMEYLGLFGTYQLIVSVESTPTGKPRKLSPALWAGGVFWPFE